jgi:hypothetical protein
MFSIEFVQNTQDAYAEARAQQRQQGKKKGKIQFPSYTTAIGAATAL